MPAKQPLPEQVVIKAPNFKVLGLKCNCTSPYVQLRFGEKARNEMREKMAKGDQAKKGKKRTVRNYDQEFIAAQYRTEEGWGGIPASAFRNAAISACRTVGFAMTKAKLSIFILADGFDETDGTPLVKISGKPEKYEAPVRNSTGVADIRVRAMWRSWSVTVRVRFDADQFSAEDIVNLFARIGMQVGVGEGRPDSKDSCGMGFGLFEVQAG
jgi:hypothetical protein